MKPGSNKKEFNKILKANNLPSIKFPDEEPEPTTTEPTPIPTETQEIEGAMATEADKSLQTQIKTRKIIRTKSTESLTGKIIEAHEIGLEFYTTKDKGWPRNISIPDLLTGIQAKRYKWKYTDNKYTEDQIIKKIRRGEINLNRSDCWFAVDLDEYRKIRQGLSVDRSPPENRDPRKIKPLPRSSII